jgi:hypothetical protein
MVSQPRAKSKLASSASTKRPPRRNWRGMRNGPVADFAEALRQ